MRKLLAHLNISTASGPSVIHAATVPMCTVRAGFSNGGLEQRELALKGAQRFDERAGAARCPAGAGSGFESVTP